MLATQVMVVDDELDLLSVTKRMLEAKGYEVHAFNEPERALDHAKVCKECRIVVSDIRMPDMNGFQLIRALKESRPDMKVVLMTAFEINQSEWQMTMPTTEVDQFLTKPFSGSQLITAIENCTLVERQS